MYLFNYILFTEEPQIPDLKRLDTCIQVSVSTGSIERENGFYLYRDFKLYICRCGWCLEMNRPLISYTMYGVDHSNLPTPSFNPLSPATSRSLIVYITFSQPGKVPAPSYPLSYLFETFRVGRSSISALSQPPSGYLWRSVDKSDELESAVIRRIPPFEGGGLSVPVACTPCCTVCMY